MTAALKEVLKKTLDNLTGTNFKMFKHLLGDQRQIAWVHLEKADTDDTVDLMMQVYSTGARDVVLTILKNLKLNQLAVELERDLERSMTATLKEVLRNTVDNLTGADFKRFKHNLRDQGQITWGKLEYADTDDTVDLMVMVYSTGAGDIMLSILRKINCNQLAVDLERDLKKSMTTYQKEVLRNTVDNLTVANFKMFKHNLRDQGQIAWGKLEKADADDTVDLMVMVYSTGAGDIMLSILRKINCNQLAVELERDLKKSMTTSQKEVLRNTVDNLTVANFKMFKHLLRDQGQIAWGKLEKADADDTVDLMVQVYSTGAGDIMLSILRKINCYQLAVELERDLKKCTESHAMYEDSVRRDGAHSFENMTAKAAKSRPSSPYTPPGQDFFHRHKAALEMRIGLLTSILCELEQRDVLTNEESEAVESERLRFQKNRALLLMLEEKGDYAQEEFYRVLLKYDMFLVMDLEGI